MGDAFEQWQSHLEEEVAVEWQKRFSQEFDTLWDDLHQLSPVEKERMCELHQIFSQEVGKLMLELQESEEELIERNKWLDEFNEEMLKCYKGW
jgi:uncharacterized protein YaaN involved in tellurite resistance